MKQGFAIDLAPSDIRLLKDRYKLQTDSQLRFWLQVIINRKIAAIKRVRKQER